MQGGGKNGAPRVPLRYSRVVIAWPVKSVDFAVGCLILGREEYPTNGGRTLKLAGNIGPRLRDIPVGTGGLRRKLIFVSLKAVKPIAVITEGNLEQSFLRRLRKSLVVL